MARHLPRQTRMRLSQVSILVVRTDDENRELMEYVLRGEGAHVKGAPNAQAALALLARAWTPTVVVSDLELQAESGCSLMRRIRDLGIDAPAVALTEADGPHVDAFNAGFQLHLSKPVAQETLVQAVQNLAGRAPAASPPGPLVSAMGGVMAEPRRKRAEPGTEKH